MRMHSLAVANTARGQSQRCGGQHAGGPRGPEAFDSTPDYIHWWTEEEEAGGAGAGVMNGDSGGCRGCRQLPPGRGGGGICSICEGGSCFRLLEAGAPRQRDAGRYQAETTLRP